jgi:hypothetical protein
MQLAEPKKLDRNHRRITVATVSAVIIACALFIGCSRGQRYRHFQTETPLGHRDVLVLGFMGGRDPWDHPEKGVRQLALKLRAMDLPGVWVETVENKKRKIALELVRNSLDRDRNERLDDVERNEAQVILYGQSFGGAAVVKLARQLDELDIPVLLTIQIDSVGRGDVVIPANVARAANLYQRNGLFIRGESRILARDPSRTTILGNFEFDYRDKDISLSEVSWMKKAFRAAHTKMDFDPEVWTKVESLILDTISGLNRSDLDRD